MSKKKGAKKGGAITAPKMTQPAAAPPKMKNLITALSSGEMDIDGLNIFKPEELLPHGNPVEKIFHSIRVQPPLPGWLLISSRHCIKGNVQRADGPAANDGDTNFELCFPKIDQATGGLSEQAQAIDAKIDRQNALLTGAPGESRPLVHIEDASHNQLPQGIIGIHCEVDPTDLETFRQDLAGMKAGNCYIICGQLVLDEGHGIYEIHPVQSIDKC